MPTRSTCTKMDDQRKVNIDQRNRLKQLQTHNLPTDDVKNINGTHKRRDLLLANKQQIVPWETERMPQRIQRHRRVTLHKSAHPQREQDQTEKSSYPWIEYKKAYDMVLQSCLKMYKISDEVINFIKKTIKTWKVELTAGRRSLAEAKIQRDIFQEDTHHHYYS